MDLVFNLGLYKPKYSEDLGTWFIQLAPPNGAIIEVSMYDTRRSTYITRGLGPVFSE